MVSGKVMKLVINRNRDCFYYLKIVYPELVRPKGAWEEGRELWLLRQAEAWGTDWMRALRLT